MQKRERLKLDLIALALLVVTVFLVLSLTSYDPADPPAQLVYPPRAHVTNLCGPIGALAAHWLLYALGLGAYGLVAVLGIVDGLLFARQRIDDPWLRAVGFAMLLIGASAAAAMWSPHWPPGPMIGTGGYVGAVVFDVLRRNLSAAGAYLVLGSLAVAGILLTTDYVVLKLLKRGGRGARRLLQLVAWLGSLASRPVRAVAALLPRPKIRVRSVPSGPVQRECDDSDESDDDARDQEGPASATADDAARGTDDSTAALRRAEPDSPDQQDDDKDRAVLPLKRFWPLRIRRPQQAPEQDVAATLESASRTGTADQRPLPALDLLEPAEEFPFDHHEQLVRRKAEILEKTVADFGYNVKVVEIDTGPVITQFEVSLEAGLRVSKIASLADDLAIALRVPSVRIVAPLPGKNTVGIEVPNDERIKVRLREVIEGSASEAAGMRIPLFLGKDVSGNPLLCDLTEMPHLLIAGRTGTGKSVCLNAMILSILMTRRPDEVRMLMIDPKMVELAPYRKVPHLMHPVVTDMKKAEAILAWAVDKMEERYDLLARAGVRHIDAYNELGQEELLNRLQPADEDERRRIPTHMPYIVILADEMADLMMTAAKEVEQHIIRLAQKSRAVGVHLVLATQKPTVDVITGLIKSNLPARISFQVASRSDSRVVLDEIGAEKLLGNGDLLYLLPGTSMLIRAQGTFVDDDEIHRLIDDLDTGEPQYSKELVGLKPADKEGKGGPAGLAARDELYESAIEVVLREQRGSVSLLQRALGIGYGRAARLVDYMAEDGIVGEYNGSQAREVLFTLEEWEAMMHGGDGERQEELAAG
ncbi:MAG: DNA translocase FtsK [Pirellulales bacterium]